MARAMTDSDISAAEASTGSKTIAELLPLAARKHGPKQAVLYNDGSAWVGKTFSEVGETVRDLSLGLVALGIEKGDKVAILANTRVEWTYFDFAVLSAGATVVPIYQSNSPEECHYILENSDSRAVVVEDSDQLAKVLEVKDQCPKLEFIIIMTGDGDSNVLSMTDLAAKGRDAGLGESDWEARWSAVTTDDICTFIYTSGTTGSPKGCVISHGNYRSMLGMIHSVNTLGTDELTYLYLPLAHSFALLIQLGSFDLGATLAYWQCDAMKILPDLSEVKPTYFPSVPRVFEKIYSAATSDVAKAGGAKEKIFNWAVSVGEKVRAKEHAGQSVSPLLKLKHGLADKLVLSKIRGLFGGNLKLAVSGAAPINPDILRFFDAAGVLVLEGWGMTETSTAATVATPDAFKFGTIGKPFPGCEIKIADDGEILVKGPNVFQGYYKNEEATRETIVDGWLHTGDIGEIDSEGYIKITGRKKDVIITAGCKNITPANLEAEIKQSPGFHSAW
ncbi:MAG: AMP-dependent synthetase/ligase [bacterium]